MWRWGLREVIDVDEDMKAGPLRRDECPDEKTHQGTRFLSHSPCEDAVRKQPAVCGPGAGKRFSLGTSPASTLIVDFPVSRTMKKKFLFKPPSILLWRPDLIIRGADKILITENLVGF